MPWGMWADFTLPHDMGAQHHTITGPWGRFHWKTWHATKFCCTTTRPVGVAGGGGLPPEDLRRSLFLDKACWLSFSTMRYRGGGRHVGVLCFKQRHAGKCHPLGSMCRATLCTTTRHVGALRSTATQAGRLRRNGGHASTLCPITWVGRRILPHHRACKHTSPHLMACERTLLQHGAWAPYLPLYRRPGGRSGRGGNHKRVACCVEDGCSGDV